MKHIIFFLSFCLVAKLQGQSAQTESLVQSFSGAFNYHISLPIVSGPNSESYPSIIDYNADIEVDQRASMVGLGLSFNPGEITRQVIGMPDDFNGNYITRNTYYQQYPSGCGSGTDCAKGYLYDVSTGTATPTAAKTKTSYYYGPIYYSNFPTTDPAANQSYNMDIITDMDDNAGFTCMPAYDNFYINTSGISGSMKLHLFDFANLIPDKSFTSGEDVKYYGGARFSSTKRPEFVCDDEYVDATVNVNDLYGGSAGSGFLPNNFVPNVSSDGTLLNNPESDDAYSLRTITDNSVHQNACNANSNRICTKKYVEYFTNADLDGASLSSVPNFLDYKLCSGGTISRSSTNFPASGIGAIQITDESGFIYHFSLPVYTISETSNDLQLNADYMMAGAENDSLVQTINNNKYAISWKLTSITGPDFVDNGNGYPDDADEGYWIRFDYNKWGEVNDRFPEYGLSYNVDFSSKDLNNDPVAYSNHESYRSEVSNYNRGFYSQKKQEVYYIEKAVTSAQSLYFFKDIRKDLSKSKVSGTNDAMPFLALKKMVLIENKHDPESLLSSDKSSVSSTLSSYGLSNDVDDIGISGSYFADQITTSFTQNSLASVEFNYDYSLCKKQFNNINSTPYGGYDAFCKQSSIDFAYQHGSGHMGFSNESESGKLTLTSVQSYDLHGSQSTGPTKFGYSTTKNADYPYYVSARDFWGYYKSDYIQKDNPAARYTTPTSGANVDAWSLNKITLPSGADINIEYESDRYKKSVNYNTEIIVKGTAASAEDNMSYLESEYLPSQDTKYIDNVTTGGVNDFDPETMGFSVYQQTDPFIIMPVDSMMGGGLRVRRISLKDNSQNTEYALNYTYEDATVSNFPYKYTYKTNYYHDPDWSSLNSGFDGQNNGTFVSYLVPYSAINTGRNTFVTPMVGYGKVTIRQEGNGEVGRLGYKQLEFNNLLSTQYSTYLKVNGMHMDAIYDQSPGVQAECAADIYPKENDRVVYANFNNKYGQLLSTKLFDNKDNLISMQKYVYDTRHIQECTEFNYKVLRNASDKYILTYQHIIIPMEMDQYIASTLATSNVDNTVPSDKDLFQYHLTAARIQIGHAIDYLNKNISNPGSFPIAILKMSLNSAVQALGSAINTGCPCDDVTLNPQSTLISAQYVIGQILNGTSFGTLEKNQLLNLGLGIYSSNCFTSTPSHYALPPTTDFLSSTYTPVVVTGYMMTPYCSNYSNNIYTYTRNYVVMNWESSRLAAVYNFENGVVKVDSTVYNNLGLESKVLSSIGDYSNQSGNTYAYASNSDLGIKAAVPTHKNQIMFKSSTATVPGYTESMTYANQIKRIKWSNGFSTEMKDLWSMKTALHAGKLKGGVTLYNYRNKPVESFDALHHYMAQKYGYQDKYIIATATNSMYSEFTHTSFEDDIYTGTSNSAVGGEVYIQTPSNIVNASTIFVSDGAPLKAHTGDKVLKMESSQTGLTYKAKVVGGYDPTTNEDTYGKLVESRDYVVYVWVSKASANLPDINVYLANADESSPSAISGLTAEEILSTPTWRLLKLEFHIPPVGTDVTKAVLIKVENNGEGNVYIDDFRVQPLAATVQAFVYDNFSGLVNYTLNANNMYTRREYDGAGRVTNEYIETKVGERLLKSHEYNIPLH